MKCSDYEFQISIDSVGELDKKSKLQLEAHLKTCANCQKVYQDTLNLQQQLTKLYQIKIDSPDVVNSVLEVIIPQRKFSYRWAWTTAVIIFAVLISYGFIFYSKKPANTKPVLTASKPVMPAIQKKVFPIPNKAITNQAPKLIKKQVKVANRHKSVLKKKIQVAYKTPFTMAKVRVVVSYVDNTTTELVSSPDYDRRDDQAMLPNDLQKYYQMPEMNQEEIPNNLINGLPYSNQLPNNEQNYPSM